MVKKEFINKSPLRILEKSMHGGVGKGNIGVIAGYKGIGKTACLIHIATYELFQDKHVIHLSFAQNTNHIITWYEDVFQEISKKRHLENALKVHDEIIKNRIIMNFNHNNIDMRSVIDRVRTVKNSTHFNANCIIVDGYDFGSGKPDDIDLIKNFAIEENLVFWFSATVNKDRDNLDKDDMPDVLLPFIENLCIIITLNPQGNIIKLKLLKDHDRVISTDIHLKLDPKTLLITEE